MDLEHPHKYSLSLFKWKMASRLATELLDNGDDHQ